MEVRGRPSLGPTQAIEIDAAQGRGALVLVVVRYCRRCQQPPCRGVAPCSTPARRPRVALRGEGARYRHALCSLGTLFSRSSWPLCLRRPVVSIAPPTLRALGSGVRRLVKRGGDYGNEEAGGRTASAADMPACDVRTVAADVRSRLQQLLGAGVVAGSSRPIFDTLSSTAVYGAQNPRVNVHSHLTGHNENGNTFLLPVHEDQQLLDSAAGNVMAMVYRFAESGDAMQHGSDAINPLLNGRAQGGRAASGARRGVETKTLPTAVPPTSSAVGANGTAPSCATVGRADKDTLSTGAARPRAAFSAPFAPRHVGL